MSEGTREGPQVGHESGAQENVPGKVHLVVENVLGSCFPPVLNGQEGRFVSSHPSQRQRHRRWP